MAGKPDVKTEKLPYTRQTKGRWYFVCSEAHVPLAGEPGSPEFVGHHALLCRLFGKPYDDGDRRSVYFMGWIGGPIKIGLADNVNTRRDTLQVACPYALEILATAPGGLRAELEYHRQFSRQRLRGEWFERCGRNRGGNRKAERMTYRAPEEWQRLRYRSEVEWRAAVEARAREIWEASEQAMWGDDPKWRNYRQSWERGTELARSKCITQAERELGQ